MKRFTIENKSSGAKFEYETESDALPELVPSEWGRPERWVPVSLATVEQIEAAKDFVLSPENEVVSVKLPAEFTVTEIDLTNDRQWIAEQVIDKRKKEYPSTDEMIVALWEKIIEGRSGAADELQAKRVAVKQKYPKAVFE